MELLGSIPKRISCFATVEMAELVDEKTPDRVLVIGKRKILDLEGNRILSKIGDREFVVVLAIEGKTLSLKNSVNNRTSIYYF